MHRVQVTVGKFQRHQSFHGPHCQLGNGKLSPQHRLARTMPRVPPGPLGSSSGPLPHPGGLSQATAPEGTRGICQV